MSEALNKLNRISKIVAIVAMIGMVAMVIVAVCAAVALIVSALYPDAVLDAIAFDGETTLGYFQVICAGLIAASIIIFAVLFYVRHLFVGITKNNTPFTDECVKDLRMVAGLILVYAIALPVIGSVASYLLDTANDLFIFSGSAFFLALMVYFIYLIFSYGTELQKESDATL
jgi:hypothetical protein